MNLSEKVIKNQFRIFYVAKSLRNRTIKREEVYKYFGNSTFSGNFLDYTMSGYGDVKILDKRLIDRNLYIEMFTTFNNVRDELWRYTNRTVRSTNLLLVDAEDIPWWQLSEFRYGKSIFKDDIDPSDIKPTIKNRNEYISYLAFLKKNIRGISGVQMKLPGF